MIWKKANAIDNSPVIQYNERKSISTERTFDKDTIDVFKLKSILTAMAENLAFQLRRGRKLTSCITVKLRYSDFQTHSVQCKIPYTAADHILVKKAKELFEREKLNLLSGMNPIWDIIVLHSALIQKLPETAALQREKPPRPMDLPVVRLDL